MLGIKMDNKGRNYLTGLDGDSLKTGCDVWSVKPVERRVMGCGSTDSEKNACSDTYDLEWCVA